jgi:hypothetical protein
MIRKLSLLLAVCVVCVPFAALAQSAGSPAAKTAPSEQSALSAYLSSGVYSSYVFRGMKLYDGMSFQPSAGVSYDFGPFGRLNANLWMQVPLEDHDVKVIDQFSENVTGLSSLNNDEIYSPEKKFVELDPTISYDISFDPVTITVGHTWYTDPEKGTVQIIRAVPDENGNPEPYSFDALYSRGDTAEFFAGISVDTILHPEATIVKDYREFEYEYYTLGFSQPIPVSKDEKMSLVPYVVFAWATGVPENDQGNFSTNYTKNGLEHVDLGIKAPVVLDNIVLTPSVNYVFTDDKNEGPDNIIWAGFSVTVGM